MFYFEDKEIISVEDIDGGEKRITVKTGEDENGNPTGEAFNLPAWEYDVNSSDSKIDASQARLNRAIYVVESIYDVLRKLDIREEELSFYIQKLISKVQGIETAATFAAFEKSQEDGIRLSDWENKL